jgi:hypothetical protein
MESTGFIDFDLPGSAFKFDLKGHWDPNSEKLEEMFNTRPITDLSLILKYREATSTLIPNQYFAEFNKLSIEPEKLSLGG